MLAAIVTVALGLGIGYSVWGTSTSASAGSAHRPAPHIEPAPANGAFLGVRVEAPGVVSGTTPPSSTTSTSTPSAPTSGAYVVTVVPSSPAAKAGIVKGDTITAFNGQSVRSPVTLQFDVLHLTPGTRAKVAWVTASGKHDAATVTLASRPRTSSIG